MTSDKFNFGKRAGAASTEEQKDQWKGITSKFFFDSSIESKSELRKIAASCAPTYSKSAMWMQAIDGALFSASGGSFGLDSTRCKGDSLPLIVEKDNSSSSSSTSSEHPELDWDSCDEDEVTSFVTCIGFVIEPSKFYTHVVMGPKSIRGFGSRDW